MIINDIRSTHNVGSLLRTAEGLGVSKVYFCGYTPYPKKSNDDRLPYITDKLEKRIDKTALGAQKTLLWEVADIEKVIHKLKDDGFKILALEQHKKSTKLHKYKADSKVALLLGNEVDGIPQDLLKQCDHILEIEMFGQKESFNVVQAAAMALYQMRFWL